MKKIKERVNIQLVKNPGKIVLGAILLFNILFFLLASGVISALSLRGTEQMNFIEAAFCTITMILDAGCISYVVEDIGQSGLLITIFCLVVVLIGMISFTGAVIGYVTNYISSFIENANTGRRKLELSGHFVILNWNSRASEIINDMLYSDEKQNIVVLVQANKADVEKRIEERISDTISRENKAIENKFRDLSFVKRKFSIHKNRLKKKINVIVREGDIFSSKQLLDISLDKARAVIILGNDINNTVCKFEYKERFDDATRGNSQTIKTLMQVSDITAGINSADNQKIIVEVTDDWTMELVDKIIETKQVDGKCNIVPVKVNEILGQILSQFCLMPELNSVYSELFSNKGVEFHSVPCEKNDEIEFVTNYLAEHNHAIPVTTVSEKGGNFSFYVAENGDDIYKKSDVNKTDFSVILNSKYWVEKKNVIILGHNSISKNIMAGFGSFCNEWNIGQGEDIVRIVVIDDKNSLEKMDYYRDYSFVAGTVEADIYDKDRICSSIEKIVSANTGDTSVLILSDDSALNEDIDANALANLIYVSDIVNRKKAEDKDFDVESIDIIVEIIDPKHHDIVNSYNVNNVIISNRYISKMITQISEYEALFNLYNDILSYDSCVTDVSESGYESKEIYIKKVSRYFETIPDQTTADQLIRAVYEASINKEKMGLVNPTIALGYIKPGGNIVLFGGDLTQITVSLEDRDKIILFSPH